MNEYLERVAQRQRAPGPTDWQNIDDDTFRRGVSEFQQKHGPFDAIVVVEENQYGWALEGRNLNKDNSGQFNRWAIMKPLTARRIGVGSGVEVTHKD